VEGHAGLVIRLTLLPGAPYDPRDEHAPSRFFGRSARLRASRSRSFRVQGWMERITDSPDGQTDVSAQEAASRQGARVPRPHEDGGRAACGRLAACEGPEAALGLTGGRSHNSLRLVMLSHPGELARLAEGGVSRTHPLLVGRFIRTSLDQTRFGLATGRRLGGAVVRNRARRRIREVLRVMAPSFQPGWDVLIIARPAIVEADHDALVGALRRVLRSGGVLGGQSKP